ncbi:Serine/threonine protein kinase [Minicystis rosea]|nr:Serine/threonine protein kinase [Minicystis rosea]
MAIAKAAWLRSPDEMTKLGTVVGSPRYMSPEQASGDTVDPRSDLWSLASLAVIAYRVFTGRMPFEGRHTVDLILEVLEICSEPPIPPSRVRSSSSPEINAFFMRALAHEPGRRFQSARELVDALPSATGQGLPPSARSTHPPPLVAPSDSDAAVSAADRTHPSEPSRRVRRHPPRRRVLRLRMVCGDLVTWRPVELRRERSEASEPDRG